MSRSPRNHSSLLDWHKFELRVGSVQKHPFFYKILNFSVIFHLMYVDPTYIKCSIGKSTRRQVSSKVAIFIIGKKMAFCIPSSFTSLPSLKHFFLQDFQLRSWFVLLNLDVSRTFKMSGSYKSIRKRKGEHEIFLSDNLCVTWQHRHISSPSPNVILYGIRNYVPLCSVHWMGTQGCALFCSTNFFIYSSPLEYEEDTHLRYVFLWAFILK